MNIFDSKLYRRQIQQISKQLPIKTGNILVTGASGLIGSCMVDVFLTANKEYNSTFNVYALARSRERLETRFNYADPCLHILAKDITEPLENSIDFNFIIHAASNADPKSYALFPVETILTNIIGAKNVLDYCIKHTCTRVMLTSTFEVYGKNNEGDKYRENYLGILDYNSIRSGYPESKRVSEILFRSYCEEHGVDSVIARLSSIYGPTMLSNDSKAHAQFIRNGLDGENIILKSSGVQKRTYCYVMDAVSALCKILFYGERGECYNVANSSSIVTIAEVANIVAELSGTKVVFELPDDIEKRGFSSPQNCILDTKKIEQLGWKGKYNILEGLSSTLQILQEVKKC